MDATCWLFCLFVFLSKISITKWTFHRLDCQRIWAFSKNPVKVHATIKATYISAELFKNVVIATVSM